MPKQIFIAIVKQANKLRGFFRLHNKGAAHGIQAYSEAERRGEVSRKKETIRVELHCHSSLSDGTLLPEQMASRLAAAEVVYASLTDHDTLEGQRSFRTACAQLGIGYISGLELTADSDQVSVHILGYGVSLDNKELQDYLYTYRPPRAVPAAAYSRHPDISAAQAIALIHKANGIAILAHPLSTEPDLGKLVPLIGKLKKAGLDGIEALQSDVDRDNRKSLCEIAESKELLVTAGTDDHGSSNIMIGQPGIDISAGLWKEFRNALLARSLQHDRRSDSFDALSASPEKNFSRMHWRAFAMNIVIPEIIALSLFAGVMFYAILPAFGHALLDRKREMIRELTNAAWSILAEAEKEERQGLLESGEARAQAIKRIEAMRYGKDAKDYFWIQDTAPRMIMHPYRKDLNGTDLSGFIDPRGVRIFSVFSDLAKRQKEGYVSYVWQWNDNPGRLEAKESYIRLFEPWGWIIGTGLYTHDVKEEVDRIQARLIQFSAAIFLVVAFLLVYIMRSSLRIERKRSTAEDLLHETTQRYKTLVNAATEGMLFIADSRCKYGNPMALDLLGYSQNDLDLVDLFDVIPDVAPNAPVHESIANLHNGSPERILHGFVANRSGVLLECAITLQSTGHAESNDFILLFRRSSSPDDGLEVSSQGLLGKLLKLPSAAAQDIREEIEKAATQEEISSLCSNAPGLVQSLLDNGASAVEIAKMLSLITDAATRRLIGMAITRFGSPPVSFAFIALGSQGRMEQTLFTDQDNAIAYLPADGVDQQVIESYFEKFSEFVCAGLSSFGYHDCKGKVMANNPKWRKPLDVWKEYFNNWIMRADVQELMEFSIFFDFRAVYGDEAITRELREHVLYRAGNTSRFFPLIAQHVLLFKSPFRLFGIVVASSGKGEGFSTIDLKASTMPFISFARLYALQQGVAQTNTNNRMEELVHKGVLLPSAKEEMMTAYALLLRLRLRNQAVIMQAAGKPDNMVDVSTLGHIEKAILRECFNEIDLLQARIRNDFLGGA
jgi:CBS domain-containing protein